MSRHDELHELMPWHLTGRLSAEERATVETHLAECDRCRRDLETLQALREEARAHGPEFFEGHPEPEALVDAVRGDLPPQQTERVTRHLKLCETCAAEAVLLRGGSAEGMPAEPRTPKARGALAAAPWLGWAAAAVLLAVVLIGDLRKDATHRTTGELTHFVLAPTGRTHGDGEQLVAVPADAIDFQLILALDWPPSDTPVELSIAPAGGGAAVFADSVDPSEEGYIFLYCPRAEFVDGEYVASVTDPRANQRREYRFRIGPIAEQEGPP